MIVYICLGLLAIALLIACLLLRAQFRRCAAQARMIEALTKGIQLEREAVKLGNDRAETLALGLNQAHAWLSIYREQIGELEDENRMLYRLLRRGELSAILSFRKVELGQTPVQRGPREIGLN